MNKLPLAHKKVLVTRAGHQADTFTQQLQALGAEVIELPTLIITPPDSWLELDRAIANLAQYHWVILTSANGVNYFFERLFFAGKQTTELKHLKWAVVGKKTAELLSKYSITPDLIPTDFIADSLITTFQENYSNLQGIYILFPRVQSGGRDVLIDELAKLGAIIHAVPAYESHCPSVIDPHALAHLHRGDIDFITFASSKTVQNFCQLLNQVTDQNIWQSWIKTSKIISIGPQTSRTCSQCIGRVDGEAPISTLEGMIATMVSLLDACL